MEDSRKATRSIESRGKFQEAPASHQTAPENNQGSTREPARRHRETTGSHQQATSSKRFTSSGDLSSRPKSRRQPADLKFSDLSGRRQSPVRVETRALSPKQETSPAELTSHLHVPSPRPKSTSQISTRESTSQIATRKSTSQMAEVVYLPSPLHSKKTHEVQWLPVYSVC